MQGRSQSPGHRPLGRSFGMVDADVVGNGHLGVWEADAELVQIQAETAKGSSVGRIIGRGKGDPEAIGSGTDLA